MPIKVPNHNSFCITHFEAEKVYKCVENDQIVSPLVFHRDFQPPIESVRPEYQVYTRRVLRQWEPHSQSL